MKRFAIPIYTSIIIYSACQSKQASNTANNTLKMEAGTVVVADTNDIIEDKLNNHHFSVTVFATDSSINGSYDIETAWGYNTAYTTIRMPYGGEHFTPLIRKGDRPYTYLIGFNFDDDTTFREYYEISGNKGQIKTRYTRSYTIE